MIDGFFLSGIYFLTLSATWCHENPDNKPGRQIDTKTTITGVGKQINIVHDWWTLELIIIQEEWEDDDEFHLEAK